MSSKKHISSNTILYLTSIVLASIIWLIAKQGEILTSEIYVKIKPVNVPKNCYVKIKEQRALVQLQFPKSQEKFVVSSNFYIEINLSDIEIWAKADEIKIWQYPLNLENVISENVPNTVKPIAIKEPKSVTVEAKLLSFYAEVRPIITGKPAEGYNIRDVVVRPDRILVTAPRELIDSLKDKDGNLILRTKPISVEGKTDFFYEFASIVLPDVAPQLGTIRLVKAEEKNVEVNIKIEENVIEKTFEP